MKSISVDDLVGVCKGYYSLPEHGTGGELHVVLDDGNLEDCWIEHAIERAKDEEDVPTHAIGLLLLAAGIRKREALYSRYEEYYT